MDREMGPNFLDEIDSGSFFDQIDDLIEFPPDNEGSNGNLMGSSDSKDLPSMWNDAFPESDPILSGSHADPTSDLSAELSVPYEDIVQLEWLSTFMDESFSGKGMTIGKDNMCTKTEPSVNQFQTSSPVSVLESSSSSSSSSVGKAMPLSSTHGGPQRARSKRPRPATFSPRAPIQLISPSSSFIETPRPFVTHECENFAESPPMKKFPKPTGPELKKKKKIKITPPINPDETHNLNKIKIIPPFNPDETHDMNLTAQPVRKCMHCEITKTPQWRAGPMGPKTLCNACGVRYKSGRLFPEYRPAASPTFVPSLHSNSHKKVLEMRGKVGPGAGAEVVPITAATPTTAKPNTEFGSNK